MDVYPRSNFAVLEPEYNLLGPKLTRNCGTCGNVDWRSAARVHSAFSHVGTVAVGDGRSGRVTSGGPRRRSAVRSSGPSTRSTTSSSISGRSPVASIPNARRGPFATRSPTRIGGPTRRTRTAATHRRQPCFERSIPEVRWRLLTVREVDHVDDGEGQKRPGADRRRKRI